ncbi:MAG: hypothetical protein WC483_01095 [Candidatus Paceibacterota bacterium]
MPSRKAVRRVSFLRSRRRICRSRPSEIDVAILGFAILGFAILGVAILGFAILGFAILGFAILGFAISFSRFSSLVSPLLSSLVSSPLSSVEENRLDSASFSPPSKREWRRRTTFLKKRSPLRPHCATGAICSLMRLKVVASMGLNSR